jgi:hypothetical protein
VSRVHSLLFVGLVVLSGFGCAEDAPRHEGSVAATASTPSITLTDQVVEAGCAQCMFGLDRPGCETAIQVNGVVFLATGEGIPDAEDHATGMCEKIQQARVSGRTAGPQFIATRFVLLP